MFVADEAELADAAALDDRHHIVDDDIARIGVGLNLQFRLDRQRLGLFQILRELRKVGVRWPETKPQVVALPLRGRSFVLTGTLPNLTRGEAR